MAEPCLRPMTEADLEGAARVEKTCFSEPWSMNLLADVLKSDLDEAWVLEGEDGTLIGYMNFRFLCGEGELMRIAVLPEYRGRGYSRKMMDQLAEAAGTQGVPDLTLEVRAGNQTARTLYKADGFKEEALRRGYYQNPTEDAVIMWRRGF